MGSFNVAVAVAQGLGCCDTAVAVDRLLRPYLRWPRMYAEENPDFELESYVIDETDAQLSGIYAFINVGGYWQSQLHPDWDRKDDPDAESVLTPIEEWRQEVKEWAKQCENSNFKVIMCRCHD